MPITIRDIHFFLNLAKTLSYICHSCSNEDKKYAVLYHLAVAGEITAKKSQKLSEDAQKLLPNNVCADLQKIRDEYVTHGGNLAAISDANIIKGIAYDCSTLETLKEIVYEIAARECIQLLSAKLEKLVALEKGQFSQVNNTLRELNNINVLLNAIDVNLLPLEVRDAWLNLWPELTTPYSLLVNDLKAAFNCPDNDKNNRLEAIFSLKKSESVVKIIDQLMVVKNTLLRLQRPGSIIKIPNFCHSTLHCLEFVRKDITSLYSSPQIMAEEKRKAEELLHQTSNTLKALIDKLDSCQEADLSAYKFGMDTEIGTLVSSILWYLLVAFSLYEVLGKEPDKDFKLFRNKAIHGFDDIDCLKERNGLKLMIEQRCIPYGKLSLKDEKSDRNPELLKRKSDEAKKEKELTSEMEKKHRHDDLSSSASTFGK